LFEIAVESVDDLPNVKTRTLHYSNITDAHGNAEYQKGTQHIDI